MAYNLKDVAAALDQNRAPINFIGGKRFEILIAPARYVRGGT